MNNTVYAWPRLWRLAVIALGVLILCSCRTAPPPPCDLGGMQSNGYATLPRGAFTGEPAAATAAAPAGPPGMEQGVPMPYTPTGPWSPPGIAGPWPADEYLRDGGHLGPPVTTGNRGEVRGLQMEDTVVQFQTADGQTRVQPSNPVFMYAPRFGAVRQVVNVDDEVQIDRLTSVHQPLKLSTPTVEQMVGAKQENLQVGDDISARPAGSFRTEQAFGTVSIALGPQSFQDRFKAYENLAVIRHGMLIESETAWLSRASDAAAVWTHKQSAQVILERRAAMAETGTEKGAAVYTLRSPENPRLRIVKVASTAFAEPGDEVDFTIRFDNVGDQTIHNVAILDSLSTRLEYIPDSAQCSRKAQFSSQRNEGDSLLIRCQLTDPLKAGEGGVIRFHCRVR
ncbi:MAG: DUF11 domain-containing protein [Thermoguttaceae bacterium]